jgi:ribosomal protein L5
MDITIVTSAHTDEESKELLANLGFPFKRDWLEG